MKVVLSLGGSVIIPDEVDVKFLKSFRKIVLDFVAKGNEIVIVTGGGSLARKYMEKAKKIAKVSEHDLDLIGIQSTKLNAELLKSVLGTEWCHSKIVDNPIEKIKTDKKIIIGSGWMPGWSTDLDAVLLAENLRADMIINMTNTDYVYDRNPNKKGAKKLENITWSQMIDLVGTSWKPGLNMPFDPVASEKASEKGLKVIIVGKDLANFKRCLAGKKYKGTTITSSEN